MASGKKAKSKKRAGKKEVRRRKHCSLPKTLDKPLPPGLSANRARAIVLNAKKWANGTQLRYYFFEQGKPGLFEHEDGTTEWIDFSANEAEMNVVRKAFDEWHSIGIGLDFLEVFNREEAEIRIGFLQGDGSWSYVGRDLLDPDIASPNLRTMNFGWRLDRSDYGYDTALHEIGHSLGLKHEHQNPNAGIVWDEPAVIEHFWLSDGWSESDTRHNILNKVAPYKVSGSNWDPNSIMHYEFEAGLILVPQKYQTNALIPDYGLSSRDKTWIKSFYPPMSAADYRELDVNVSQRLEVLPGEQANFTFRPEDTKNHTLQLFGEGDCVMVLFENEGANGMRYRAGEDDAGLDTNGSIRYRFQRGREYVIRVRLNYAARPDNISLMIW